MILQWQSPQTWRMALGDQKLFLSQFPSLAGAFRSLSGQKDAGLNEIWAFVKTRNYELTPDPAAFRAAVAAFAVLLIEQHNQRLVLGGIFSKKILVRSKGLSRNLLELFYRCVFEDSALNSRDVT